jgi:hypothetical protein
MVTAGLGGLPDLRVDQQSQAPQTAVSPGSGNVVRARLVIIFGLTGGLFVYSGTPAFGNLIFSIAAVAGTDQFGNSYLAGETSYSTSGILNINGGVQMIYP